MQRSVRRPVGRHPVLPHQRRRNHHHGIFVHARRRRHDRKRLRVIADFHADALGDCRRNILELVERDPQKHHAEFSRREPGNFFRIGQTRMENIPSRSAPEKVASVFCAASAETTSMRVNAYSHLSIFEMCSSYTRCHFPSALNAVGAMGTTVSNPGSRGFGVCSGLGTAAALPPRRIPSDARNRALAPERPSASNCRKCRGRFS